MHHMLFARRLQADKREAGLCLRIGHDLAVIHTTFFQMLMNHVSVLVIAYFCNQAGAQPQLDTVQRRIQGVSPCGGDDLRDTDSSGLF